MQIASFVVQPVRVTYDETVSGTHVLLRLRTDDGPQGGSFVSRIGGTNIGALAALIEATAERMRGEEVLDAEAFFAKAYRGGVGGPLSGLELRAASAVETAAWDL